jgi:hypothetical protein
MNYRLVLNGCPILILPATLVKGITLLTAWDTLSLEHLHAIGKEKIGIDMEKRSRALSLASLNI